MRVAVYFPESWDRYPDGYMDYKDPMTKKGTCQSLQSTAQSLALGSEQKIYFFLTE